jgi:hypothetical protein
MAAEVEKPQNIIRDMKTNDIPQALILLKEFYEEMEYEKRGFNFDVLTVSCALKAHVVSKETGTFVIENNGEIAGIGAVIIVPNFMDTNQKKAVEVVWHTDPKLSPYKRAKLFKDLHLHMEDWVKERGCNTFHISVEPHSPAATFLERQDYKLREFCYSKEI